MFIIPPHNNIHNNELADPFLNLRKKKYVKISRHRRVINWRECLVCPHDGRRKLESDTVLLLLPFQANAFCYGNLDDVLLDESSLPSSSRVYHRVL
jgi:hypothetical protein